MHARTRHVIFPPCTTWTVDAEAKLDADKHSMTGRHLFFAGQMPKKALFILRHFMILVSSSRVENVLLFMVSLLQY